MLFKDCYRNYSMRKQLLAKHLRPPLDLLHILRSEYTKLIVLGMIIFAFDFGVWFGLRVGFRAQYPLLAVASWSMEPTLTRGDMILVQGVLDAGEINVRDIIVFRKPGTTIPFNLPFTSDTSELIVHRVVKKIYNENDGKWYFQTQGDANKGGPDFWHGDETWGGMLSETLLIGRVVSWVPWVGHIPLFIRTPAGMFVVVLLILIILFIEFIPIPEKETS